MNVLSYVNVGLAIINIFLFIRNIKLNKNIPILKPKLISSNKKNGPFIKLLNEGKASLCNIELYMKDEENNDNDWLNISGPNNITESSDGEHYIIGFHKLVFHDRDNIKVEYETVTGIRIKLWWEKAKYEGPNVLTSKIEDYNLIKKDIRYFNRFF